LLIPATAFARLNLTLRFAALARDEKQRTFFGNLMKPMVGRRRF
jgi:hypothetical protein